MPIECLQATYASCVSKWFDGQVGGSQVDESHARLNMVPIANTRRDVDEVRVVAVNRIVRVWQAFGDEFVSHVNGIIIDRAGQTAVGREYVGLEGEA